nr:hypothetical protein [Pseudopedobacter saltans]
MKCRSFTVEPSFRNLTQAPQYEKAEQPWDGTGEQACANGGPML